MGRSIKFRGINNGKWVYGSLFERTISEGFYIAFENTARSITELQVVPKTVGQDTGLKDKTGKEIYEGDKVEGFGQTGIVIWSTTAAMFNVCGFYNSSFDFPTCAFSENMDFKIIGNIHEEKA